MSEKLAILQTQATVLVQEIPYRVKPSSQIIVKLADLELVWQRKCCDCGHTFEVKSERARRTAKRCPQCKRLLNIHRNRIWRKSQKK